SRIARKKQHRTSEAPVRLGSIVWVNPEGSPVRKWACRSTKRPWRAATEAMAAFTRPKLARAPPACPLSLARHEPAGRLLVGAEGSGHAGDAVFGRAEGGGTFRDLAPVGVGQLVAREEGFEGGVEALEGLGMMTR